MLRRDLVSTKAKPLVPDDDVQNGDPVSSDPGLATGNARSHLDVCGELLDTHSFASKVTDHNSRDHTRGDRCRLCAFLQVPRCQLMPRDTKPGSMRRTPADLLWHGIAESGGMNLAPYSRRRRRAGSRRGAGEVGARRNGLSGFAVLQTSSVHSRVPSSFVRWIRWTISADLPSMTEAEQNCVAERLTAFSMCRRWMSGPATVKSSSMCS